jgi:hypothetical protein
MRLRIRRCAARCTTWRQRLETHAPVCLLNCYINTLRQAAPTYVTKLRVQIADQRLQARKLAVERRARQRL